MKIQGTEVLFNTRTIFIGGGISIIKTRWTDDCFVFYNGDSITDKTASLHFEMTLCTWLNLAHDTEDSQGSLGPTPAWKCCSIIAQKISLWAFMMTSSNGKKNSPSLALCTGKSPMNSPHKGQWCRALMFSLICAWKYGLVKNRDTSDFRSHQSHYEVTVRWLAVYPWKMRLKDDFIKMEWCI